MLDRIKFDTITMLSKIQVRSQAEIEREELERQQRLSQALQLQHAEAVSPIQAPPGAGESGAFPGAGPPADPPMGGPRAGAAAVPTPFVRQVPKVGRNEMCPCGSGKKYKHCHGALQQASG
jgi:preprotein translocase subunit SecA